MIDTTFRMFTAYRLNTPYQLYNDTMGKYDPAPTVAAGLIRLARAKTGLTQGELAKRAGVSQQAISAYETGRKDPTLSSLQRMIRASGLELTFRLEPLDGHDEALEEYIAALSPDLRTRVEAHQRERVDAARLDRKRGR